MAYLGEAPQFVGCGFLILPRIAQSLNRNIDADPVSEAETVSDGLGDGVNRDAHSFDPVPFNAGHHHFSRELHDAEGERRTSAVVFPVGRPARPRRDFPW
jgi:hypothetical protein